MLIAVRDGEFLGTRLALSFTELCYFNKIMLLNYEIINNILARMCCILCLLSCAGLNLCISVEWLLIC